MTNNPSNDKKQVEPAVTLDDAARAAAVKTLMEELQRQTQLALEAGAKDAAKELNKPQ